MILPLLMALATPAAAGTPIMVAGVGGESCATAFEAQNELVTRQWIDGFMTGMNYAHNGVVGANTDVAGIVAEVRKRCAEDPSAKLFMKAAAAYRHLSALRR